MDKKIVPLAWCVFGCAFTLCAMAASSVLYVLAVKLVVVVFYEIGPGHVNVVRYAPDVVLSNGEVLPDRLVQSLGYAGHVLGITIASVASVVIYRICKSRKHGRTGKRPENGTGPINDGR